MTEFDIAELARKRRDHLARLLDRTFTAVEAEVQSRLEEGGYGLERVYLPVVRNVSLDGSRITNIAERAGLSKQTVGPLVRNLEERGILRVDPDPTDGRAKLVRYTDLGFQGLSARLDSIKSIERSCAQALGAGGLNRLKRDLKTVLEVLGKAEEDL